MAQAQEAIGQQAAASRQSTCSSGGTLKNWAMQKSRRRRHTDRWKPGARRSSAIRRRTGACIVLLLEHGPKVLDPRHVCSLQFAVCLVVAAVAAATSAGFLEELEKLRSLTDPKGKRTTSFGYGKVSDATKLGANCHRSQEQSPFVELKRMPLEYKVEVFRLFVRDCSGGQASTDPKKREGVVRLVLDAGVCVGVYACVPGRASGQLGPGVTQR